MIFVKKNEELVLLELNANSLFEYFEKVCQKIKIGDKIYLFRKLNNEKDIIEFDSLVAATDRNYVCVYNPDVPEIVYWDSIYSLFSGLAKKEKNSFKILINQEDEYWDYFIGNCDINNTCYFSNGVFKYKY